MSFLTKPVSLSLLLVSLADQKYLSLGQSTKALFFTLSVSGIVNLEQRFFSGNLYVTTARAFLLCPAMFLTAYFFFQSFSFKFDVDHDIVAVLILHRQ